MGFLREKRAFPPANAARRRPAGTFRVVAGVIRDLAEVPRMLAGFPRLPAEVRRGVAGFPRVLAGVRRQPAGFRRTVEDRIRDAAGMSGNRKIARRRPAETAGRGVRRGQTAGAGGPDFLPARR